ncbi:tetratricopeptide repeat protein [candidate division KSB1 bacterium]|nr:tetratricopeptide repeat protein [candidate division KSB1 bacterium]
MARSKKQLGPRKKTLFYVILVLFPFIVLLFIELFLRLFHYGGNLDLFITGPEEQIAHYWMCNPNIGERYFFRQNTRPAPPKDLFLKEKPENGYRIFALGGSTTAGFPYGYNLMFPRILNYRLSEIFPEHHIEVVNTAMSAVNSYTLYDFMDEILAQKPDAVLIYAGHNEFYGALGVGSLESLGRNPKLIYLYLKLQRLKIFLLVRNVIGSIQKTVNKVAAGSDNIDPSNTLMARIVAEQNIPYKSELYERGLKQFEQNMRGILEKARAQAVPIYLSELVSNIKDQAPFVSVKQDSFPTAKRAFDIGRKLLTQGDYQDARIALFLAKDLDALRFRATEEMNDIIHRLGQEYNTPVVPMQAFFEAWCEHQLIGNELILEHLHPNIKGYFVMADAFLNTLREQAAISATWDTSRLRPWEEDLTNWGLTALDTVAANLSITYLKGGWPFQPAMAHNHMLDNYHARTRLDSIALRIMVDSNYSEVVGHLDMGEYYEQQGQYDKAFLEYKAAYYIIPFELQFYEKAVRALLQQQRINEAYQILKLSFKYGSTPLTNKWMGQLLARANYFAQALPYLERAATDRVDDKEILLDLALCYEKTGQFEKAHRIRQQHGFAVVPADSSMDPKPMIYSALIKKAQDYLGEGNYQQAMPLLRQAHEIKPTLFTYKWIGLLYLHFGGLKEGVEYLEKVIEMQPDDFETYYNLCHAYIKLENKQRAGALLSAMEKLRPQFDDPQNLRELYENL